MPRARSRRTPRRRVAGGAGRDRRALDALPQHAPARGDQAVATLAKRSLRQDERVHAKATFEPEAVRVLSTSSGAYAIPRLTQQPRSFRISSATRANSRSPRTTASARSLAANLQAPGPAWCAGSAYCGTHQPDPGVDACPTPKGGRPAAVVWLNRGVSVTSSERRGGLWCARRRAWHCMTARGTKFSEAIISRVPCWRPISHRRTSRSLGPPRATRSRVRVSSLSSCGHTSASARSNTRSFEGS